MATKRKPYQGSQVAKPTGPANEPMAEEFNATISMSNDFGFGDVSYDEDELRVYFYSEVTQGACKELTMALRHLEQISLWQAIMDKSEPKPIKLHIQSVGGSLMAAFGVMNVIANELRVPVHTYAEGYTISAGTLIAVVGHKRFMQRYSDYMVHQLSSGFWGTYSDFEDEMELLSRLMDRIVKIYSERTGLSQKKIRKMLKKDFWMDAEQAVALGFVDEIV